MRWFVEIAPLGKSSAPLATLCLEAPKWAPALARAREIQGEKGPLSRFSIEVLEEGYCALDASSRLAYRLREAPADAPLTPGAKPEVPAARPSSRKLLLIPEQPGDSLPPPPAPPPPPVEAAAAPPVSAPSHLPAFQKLSERAEDAGDAALMYRELAYAVAPGTDEALAEALLLDRFAAVRAGLGDNSRHKFVNLAVFDHVFQGRPKRPPLAVLAWKDWKSPDPKIGFPMRDGTPSRPSAASLTPTPPPAQVVSLASVSFDAPAKAPEPPPAVPVVAEAIPVVAEDIPVVAEDIPVVAEDIPVVVDEVVVVEGPVEAARPPPPAPPPPPDEAEPIALVPSSRRGGIKPNDALPLPPSRAVKVAAATPAPVVEAPPSSRRAPAHEAHEAPPSSTRSRRMWSDRPGRPGRVTGEDLLTALFEESSDLHFLQDALEGAQFALKLALDKVPSEIGLVHLFDINKREFVVVRQHGGAKDALTSRMPERTPIARAAMRTKLAVVVTDAAADDRIDFERWASYGVRPVSVLCAPVELAGRYLGLIELANPEGDQPYSDSDGHAFTYLGQQLAELVASRGVITDAEQITERRGMRR